MNFSEAKAQTLTITTDLRNIAINSVRDVLTDDSGKFQKDLSFIEDQIANVKFTVGVIGDFNVGKSTFLNALLGREILSTKILPETAAITSLKYGEKDNAVVYFWTTEEWQAIESQGKSEDKGDKPSKITKMVIDVKKELGSKFYELITEKGEKIDNIKLCDLDKYTSANSTHGYSKLVKEVELITNLEFCKDNIQVVDTPGLNDPVRFREHITVNKFLPSCDMMVLLLPVRQSFSEYIRKFLESQIRKGNLHKLFVIINQIDLLHGRETLDSIIDFTRSQLTDLFENSKDLLEIDQIEIFPMSAYQAVLNRIQSSEAKMTDEETGVPAFERRLRRFLFEGERAKKTQEIWKNRLYSITSSQLNQIEKQLSLLDKPLIELEKEISKQSSEFNIIRLRFNQAKEECDKTIQHFDMQYDIQTKTLEERIRSLFMDIQSKAIEKIEQVQFKDMASVESWSKKELQPFINDQILDGSKIIIDDTEKYIHGLMNEAVLDIGNIYKQAGEDITERLLEVSISGDYVVFSGLGYSVLAIGAGTVANMAIATAIAHWSYGLAGTFILTGPIGWAVGLAAGIGLLIGGFAVIKDKVISNLKENIIKYIPVQLNDYAEKCRLTFDKNKPTLVEQLQQIALNPVHEIEKEIQQQEASLRQLLKDKDQQVFDIEKKRNELTTEKMSFENVAEKIKMVA